MSPSSPMLASCVRPRRDGGEPFLVNIAVAAAVATIVVAATALASCASQSTASSVAASAVASGTFPGAGLPVAINSDIPFVSLEGPLWIGGPGGGHLLFSDVVEANAPGARIYELEPSTHSFSTLPYPSPNPGPTSTNGLAVDRSGALVACERFNARVIRLDSAGHFTVLADREPESEALPLNAPNDLVVRHDGNVYFTDSDWGARPGSPHAAMAVYRVAPDGAVTRVITLEKPNGIALSPDGSVLYVGSDTQAKVWKLPLDASGVAGDPSLLIDGATVPGGFKVPDGICVDDAGALYVANNDDAIKAILVFSDGGRLLGRIPFPARPSNCTFGGADRRTMYVTTLHAVYEVHVPTPGLP